MGIGYICEGLAEQHNGGLQTLVLWSTQLTSHGAGYLANALVRFTSGLEYWATMTVTATNARWNVHKGKSFMTKTSTLLSTFPYCSHCMTTKWNLLKWCFNKDIKQTRTKFTFLLWTWMLFLGHELQKNLPLLILSNSNLNTGSSLRES